MERKTDIMRKYDEKAKLYDAFSAEVKHQLERILAEEGIQCNAITCRVKSRDSLSKKIDRKADKYACLEDLTDIAGVRVITYYSGDVDRVADIVEREFAVDRENSIDKRAAMEPDRFGYCSVHYVVRMSDARLGLTEYHSFRGLRCEIQIRSVLQHAWAEIEHDLGYKNPEVLPKDIRRDFSRLAGLLELADKEFQGIRDFLLSYAERAAETLEQTREEDIELDAVLLRELIETNSALNSINAGIEKLFAMGFEDMTPRDLEVSVTNLRWLGVTTVRELLSMIDRYGEKAVRVAQLFTASRDTAQERDNRDTIRKTIAIFYLCYTQLVTEPEKYDRDSLVKYLTDNHIGLLSDVGKTAQRLLDVRQALL